VVGHKESTVTNILLDKTAVAMVVQLKRAGGLTLHSEQDGVKNEEIYKR
jgi:hypothetical protein